MEQCEAMREFLKRGTFYDLGFYLYLKKRVRLGEWFLCREIGDELFVEKTTILFRLRKMKALGVIDYEGSTDRTRGCRITAFKLEGL